MLRARHIALLLLVTGRVLAGEGTTTSAPESWLRRAWLDLSGAPPPVEEVDAFLARPDAEARRAQVERLIASPDCAARWARLLAAPLGPRDEESSTAGRALEPFLTRELRAARPWWQTLGALVTPGKAGSPAALFQRPFHDDGTLIAGQIGSGMLGIQLRCARCHDDPVHGWSAAEHFGLAAFYGRPRSVQAPSRLVTAFRAGRIRNFYDLVMHLPTMKPRGPDHRWVRAEVQRAAGMLEQMHRLGLGPSPPSVDGLDWAAYDIYRLHATRARMAKAGGSFSGTSAVPVPGTVEELRMPRLVALQTPVSHPTGLKPGQTVPPRFPGDRSAARTGARRREALAAWIADPQNRFTARALVNRTWSLLVGRGLVEPIEEVEHPVDPSGSRELEELASAFVRAGGTVPWLLRRIVSSPEYARSTAPLSPVPVTIRDGEPQLVEPPETSVSGDVATTGPVEVDSPTAPVSPIAAAASLATTTATSAPPPTPEATVRLAAFRFRESEGACPREREPERDAVARLSARGLRVLDGDQIAAALAAATGRTVDGIASAVRDEVDSALALWAASARTLPSDDAVVESFPPRMLSASLALQELVRTAPVLETLAGFPDDGARIERLFRRTLARPPSAAEKTAVIASLPPAGASLAGAPPAGRSPAPGAGSPPDARRGAWSAVLFRLVTSAEFLTNH